MELKCTIYSGLLAYFALVYLLSSIYYMWATRDMGTPFNDSLTPHQQEIKKQASEDRGMIFTQGVIGSILLMILFRPIS